MEPEHRDLIARELGKLGRVPGASAHADVPRGAFSMDIEVPKPPEQALERCVEALSGLGTLLTAPDEYADAAPDGLTHPTVAGMTGVGLRTVAPALVACSIVPVGAGSTTVRLFATAPMSFRKKGKAEGAARRVASLVLEED